MPFVEVDVDVEVYCATCGAGLCNQTESTHGHHRGEPQFRVDPCERCLGLARDSAYDDGYYKGYKDAIAELEKQDAEEH